MAPVVRPDLPAVPAVPAGFDPELFRSWTPEVQQRALDLLQSRQIEPHRPFYCPVATCNGRPHGDWQWNHARADQRPPLWSDDWFIWLIKGGRGSGKTRTGAEMTHRLTKITRRIALVAPTSTDFRETMVEGVSGILACSKPDNMPEFEPSKKKLTWPNGAIAQGFSGEEPGRLRGPQHGFAWVDEPAHIDLIDDVWDNLLFGLRLGKNPRIICTTTPTPIKWIKDLIKDPMTRVSNPSTYDNLENLAPSFQRTVLKKYEGTRLGQQELYGEVLEDIEGSLWKSEMFHWVQEPPQLDRIVVSIDPAGTANKRSDLTGIIVLGIAGEVLYVLADYTGKYSPHGWATAAIRALENFSGDAIVAEKNYGGDMVRAVLEGAGFTGRVIDATSRRGKAIRAEPIVGLYEKTNPVRVYHVQGATALLEDEQTSWVPGKGDSPNRVDALVHGATELGHIAMPSEVASPADMFRGQSVA
jgi:phage terminase large subunit-like protein